MSLHSQRSSPLSHPFEVNGYLTALELRPQCRQLIDISGIPVRERRSTENKSQSTVTLNLYRNFSRKENFCWSVVTWTLIRCPWSRLMLWECSSAICSLTSKHLREKGLCSAWDSLAQEAICSKAFIAHTHKIRSPEKANGQNTCCIISVTSDVKRSWRTLNVALDEKENIFDAVEFLPAALPHAITAEIKLFPGFSWIIHTHLPQRWTSLKVLWLSNTYVSYLWFYKIIRSFPGIDTKQWGCWFI